MWKDWLWISLGIAAILLGVLALSWGMLVRWVAWVFRQVK